MTRTRSASDQHRPASRRSCSARPPRRRSSSGSRKKTSASASRIGIVVALIVLVIVFGALVAGVTPIIMGIFAIAVTLGIVGLIGQVWRFSFFAPNLITMMGLAVGIDYSLFIVSRYREERQRGLREAGCDRRGRRNGEPRRVLQRHEVVLALAGMLIVPTTIFRWLAGGAIIVVLVSVAGVDDAVAGGDRAARRQDHCRKQRHRRRDGDEHHEDRPARERAEDRRRDDQHAGEGENDRSCR